MAARSPRRCRDAAVAGEAIEAEPPRRQRRRRGRRSRAAEAEADDDDFDDGAGPDHQRHGRPSCAKASWPPSTPSPPSSRPSAACRKSWSTHRLKGEDLAEADRKAYEAATTTIVQHLKTLKLNNNRIEALVEQLYAINKRLMGLEGRLLRLADSYGISPRASS